MRKNDLVKKLEKLLDDSPYNEQIFFFAAKNKGGFFLDDPKDPAALIAVTDSKESTCFLRTLKDERKVDWISLIKQLKPAGALSGQSKLIRRLSVKLGYGTPLEEVIFAQKGYLQPTEKLAEKIIRYEPALFHMVDNNARWLWEKFGSLDNALACFPMFGIVKDNEIVACSMVCSFSHRYANIGYWVHDGYRNQNHGTRCAAALVAHINEKGQKAMAITNETHLPSLSIIRKLGLVEYCRYSLAPNLPENSVYNPDFRIKN